MYKEGATTLGANLRDAAKAAPLLLELSKQQPPEAPEWPNKCTDCGTSRPSNKAALLYDRARRRRELRQGRPRRAGISRQRDLADAADHDGRSHSRQTKSRRSTRPIPRQALVKPRQARKLLIIDVCPAGGFYHNTVAHGNLMLQLIAKYTGAYEPIFDNNLENLKYPRIRQYDAVFLNSVVGPVFSDPEVLDGLIRYVREGGGVAGLHGTTFASQDLREFGELMGAQEGPHQYNGEPGTLKIDDPASPLTKHFGGKGFSMMDEFYHFPMTGPYSREKLHVLLSVDAEKSDLKKWQYLRTDNDFGMVWIKREGKGRVFNSVLGHRPEFYMMPDLVKMMLGGIQFVLGDLDADTTPSATADEVKSDVQVARQERNAAPAPEQMLGWKDLLLDAIRSVEDAIDPAHFIEALDARADRKDVVLFSRFDEQRSRRYQTREIVHLRPVQNSRNVVVDAMGEAPDAVAECVQVAAHECGADPQVEGRCEHRHSAAP